MSQWITIKVDDLADYLVAPQLDALRTAALGDGQGDPFEKVMPDRCSYVRNRISGRVIVSATPNSIPPELKTCVCNLIIESMQGRLAMVGLPLGDDQKRSIERAYKDLDIAGTESFSIDNPDDPMTPATQTTGGIRVVKNKSGDVRRDTMGGL